MRLLAPTIMATLEIQKWTPMGGYVCIQAHRQLVKTKMLMQLLPYNWQRQKTCSVCQKTAKEKRSQHDLFSRTLDTSEETMVVLGVIVDTNPRSDAGAASGRPNADRFGRPRGKLFQTGFSHSPEGLVERERVPKNFLQKFQGAFLNKSGGKASTIQLKNPPGIVLDGR